MPFSSYNHFKPVMLFTGLNSRNIVSLQVSRFSPRVSSVSRNNIFCSGLKKVVAKSRTRVYFEQQIVALLFVFHQTRNLPWIYTKQISQSDPCISWTQHLLRDKIGEKRETSTQNLPWNNVAQQVEGFCIPYFAAFMSSRFRERNTKQARAAGVMMARAKIIYILMIRSKQVVSLFLSRYFLYFEK